MTEIYTEAGTPTTLVKIYTLRLHVSHRQQDQEIDLRWEKLTQPENNLSYLDTNIYIIFNEITANLFFYHTFFCPCDSWIWMAMGRAPQCVVFAFLQSHFTFFGLDLGCYKDLQGVHNADWAPHDIYLAFVITCKGKVRDFKVEVIV